MAGAKGSEAAAVNRTSLEVTSDREFVIARAFNGPAHIVFDAWTRPELVRRWWAPRSLGDVLASCEADVRAGGRYRYVLRPRAGGECAFSGEYSEVSPPSRLVYTQFFEPTASGVETDAVPLIVTVTFDERDGKTHVISHNLCASREMRDMILESGMEHGMRETMDQLEELVASLR